MSATDWRRQGRRHRVQRVGIAKSSAAILLNIHRRDLPQMISEGLIRLTEDGRVEVQSLIQAGVPIKAIEAAEVEYARRNHENYLRRRARKAAKR